jgi:formate dehydrogenase maturation protein FdhE
MTSDPRWRRRIERANQLASEHPAAASLLTFYARLLREQQKMYDGFDACSPTGSIESDVSQIHNSGVGLLRAVARDGPDQLTAEARRLLESPAPTCHDLLLAYWRDRSDRLFFPKALLQPYGEWLAQSRSGPIAAGSMTGTNRCPRCGGAPQLAILDSSNAISADGSSRHLQCATCLSPWAFRRVMCPSCGNEDERTLGYYQSPALAHVRVDACETCHRYLKTIDLAKQGFAVPLVDEIAGAPLDLWAAEHGYEKIELNLAGL